MTQDESWYSKWQEAIDFLETNHRKPSKFIPEEGFGTQRISARMKS